MAYQRQEIGLLVRLRPNEAVYRIISAYKVCKGNERAAAKMLEVGVTSLKRWRKILDEAGHEVTVRVEEFREKRRVA